MRTAFLVRPAPTLVDLMDKTADRVPNATDWLITISWVYGVIWRFDFVPVVAGRPDQSKTEARSTSTLDEVEFTRETFALSALAANPPTNLIDEFRALIITFFDPTAYDDGIPWSENE